MAGAFFLSKALTILRHDGPYFKYGEAGYQFGNSKSLRELEYSWGR